MFIKVLKYSLKAQLIFSVNLIFINNNNINNFFVCVHQNNGK
jgi:hypothetical protein